ENEVLQSVFMNKASDLEDTFVNDRYADGMHAIPPPVTGIYMPSRPDVDIDYSKFTYGPKQTSTDELDSKPSEYASCESDSSVETSTSMPEPVENTSKVVRKPKVWTDTAIIEEYESDSDNALMSNVQEDKEKHSFAFTDSVKHVKTSRENIKETGTTVLKLRSRIEMVTLERVWDMLSLEKHALFVDDPHRALKDKGIVDSGCSRHITGNKAHLMCGKKNKVLFIDTDCLVLSPDFKLPDENQVLLKILRQHNMYSFNLKNIDPSRDLACWFAKASIDESNEWFSWVYFLKSKDEITPILKDFIRQAKNQFYHKVKTIRSDNRTKFKKKDLIELCGLKGITREYSNARTPQQIGVAERKNKTLIEAVDSFLPTTFGVEAVNTACYFLNRVLVTKPQNKTPYELLTGKQPIISYLRPIGCHVTILNTIDQLGKFDGKYDSGFLVGYSLNSKAFRVYNLETKRVEENLHVKFLENKPNIAEKGHAWMF
nr:ribonuclease H-like domain-containing protein [Tanacetum cinerariifolium]